MVGIKIPSKKKLDSVPPFSLCAFSSSWDWTVDATEIARRQFLSGIKVKEIRTSIEEITTRKAGNPTCQRLR